jgi:hypothetical protein
VVAVEVDMVVVVEEDIAVEVVEEDMVAVDLAVAQTAIKQYSQYSMR